MERLMSEVQVPLELMMLDQQLLILMHPAQKLLLQQLVAHRRMVEQLFRYKITSGNSLKLITKIGFIESLYAHIY